jgi:hypothetical protein
MSKYSHPVMQGQAGVYHVVSELIARGHEPYLPAVDRGIDILLRSGVRLQVKTTRGPTQHWRQKGRICFMLSTAQSIKKQQYVPKQPRKFSEQCDFVILWCMKPSRTWVVPAVVLDGRYTLSIGETPQWKACDVAEATRLRAEGLSFQAIADHLGVERETVRRRVLGKFVEPKRNYADLAQYEDRWDLISGAVATLTEANAIVPAAAKLVPVKE